VLKITTTSDRTGTYYLTDRAREVTDVTGHAPGTWLGSSARAFGLIGAVRSAQLEGVLEGRPPGATLRRSPRRTVGAYDLIVAAPKCVSVLFADPDHHRAVQVIDAHHQALDVALDYCETRVASVRRRSVDSEEGHRVAGLLGARFTHGVSRSGDPHLHSHLLIANMAQGSDGRFSALDARAFFAHRRAIDALYRAELRRGLVERLGVHWERDDAGRDQLAEVSGATIATFSTRSAQLRSDGPTWGEKATWSRAQAEAHWADRRAFEPILEEPPRRRLDGSRLDEYRFASLVARDAVRRRDLVAAWADAAPAGIEAQVIGRAVDKAVSNPGHGIFEAALLSSEFRVRPSLVRMLGPRPVEGVALESWWRRAELLERRRDPGRRHHEGPFLSAPDRDRGRGVR
jgi:conjugative relaxase-like TrwC/TraI family protein